MQTDSTKTSYTIFNITYAEKPDVGIPLADEIIHKEISNKESFISSAVYLGYRVLDGTYKNIDDCESSINRAFSYCKDIRTSTPQGYRWILSLTLLKTYMSAITKSPSIIEKNLLEETYSIPFVHTSQLSNYTKLSILVALSRKDDAMKKDILDIIDKHDLSKQEHMSRNVINDLLKPYLESSNVSKKNEILTKYQDWYIYKDFIKTIYILEK